MSWLAGQRHLTRRSSHHQPICLTPSRTRVSRAPRPALSFSSRGILQPCSLAHRWHVQNRPTSRPALRDARFFAAASSFSCMCSSAASRYIASQGSAISTGWRSNRPTRRSWQPRTSRSPRRYMPEGELPAAQAVTAARHRNRLSLA